MPSTPDPIPRQLRDRLLPPAGPHFVLDERLPVLVEFNRPEEQSTPLSEAAHTQASAQAINSALNSVRNVAKMVSEAMSGLPNSPSQMDVKFGLRLDASGKAFVVESGDAASLAVTLTWTPQPTGTAGYEPRNLNQANEGWADSPEDSSAGWEQDSRMVEDESEWEDEDDWGEDDAQWRAGDRLEEDYPPYDPRGYDEEEYGPGGYEEDEDYDYPEPRSWPRRSPRLPWNRNPQRGIDPRSRWP